MRLRSVVLLGLALPCAAVAADTSNAKWDGGRPVGVHIYDRDGTCEALKEPVLAIGTKDLQPGASAASIPAKDLHYCLLFLGGEKSANCAGGSVTLTFDASQNAYRGKYELSFKNGEKRSGEIRAQVCKPAAKKGG